MKARVLSGVQPTGSLHLGNYLGAIRHWVEMQDKQESLFCIVDLHAITVPQKPEELRAATLRTAAAYIACGIDPERSAVFVQSHVPEHTELSWVLSCFTQLGWLNRMTQFKEKAGKHKETASLGLYGYPVLMAADILLYKATHVPVGEDQKQHLELCRDIAGAFNRHYNQEIFPLPEPLILGETTRVMSLRDGRNKMSKSDASDQSRIHLTDSDDEIVKKIQKARTDAGESIGYDVEKRPESSNLLSIYCALSGEKRDAVIARFTGQGFAPFKKALAEVLVEKLRPIRTKMLEIEGDSAYLQHILGKGAERARVIASETLQEIRQTMGMVTLP